MLSYFDLFQIQISAPGLRGALFENRFQLFFVLFNGFFLIFSVISYFSNDKTTFGIVIVRIFMYILYCTKKPEAHRKKYAYILSKKKKKKLRISE